MYASGWRKQHIKHQRMPCFSPTQLPHSPLPLMHFDDTSRKEQDKNSPPQLFCTYPGLFRENNRHSARSNSGARMSVHNSAKAAAANNRTPVINSWNTQVETHKTTLKTEDTNTRTEQKWRLTGNLRPTTMLALQVRPRPKTSTTTNFQAEEPPPARRAHATTYYISRMQDNWIGWLQAFITLPALIPVPIESPKPPLATVKLEPQSQTNETDRYPNASIKKPRTHVIFQAGERTHPRKKQTKK